MDIPLDSMSKDLFRQIIMSGKLKGKDLIALCGSGGTVSDRCDQDDYFIFRQLLLKEFNIKILNQHNPRDLYVEMHHIADAYQLFLRRIDTIHSIKFAHLNSPPKYQEDIIDPFDGMVLERNDLKTVYGLLYGYYAMIRNLSELRLPLVWSIMEERSLLDRLTDIPYMIETTHGPEIIDIDGMDLEDVWYEMIRPRLEQGEVLNGVFLKEGNRLSIESYGQDDEERHDLETRDSNFTIADIDLYWDHIAEVVSQIPEKDLQYFHLNRTYQYLLRRKPSNSDDQIAIMEVLDDLRNLYREEAEDRHGNVDYDGYEQHDELIEEMVAYTANLLYKADEDLFNLSEAETDMLLSLHRLIVDKTISPTMPLSLFEGV